METKDIRDIIIEKLKTCGNSTSVKFDGFHLSGADFAIENGDGVPDEFRITVVRHNKESVGLE